MLRSVYVSCVWEGCIYVFVKEMQQSETLAVSH